MSAESGINLNTSLLIYPLSDATCVEELSNSSTQISQEQVSDGYLRHKQDRVSVYRMTRPEVRRIIIQRIDSGDMVSECKSEKKWWATKHHPKREIPQNIYLLGNGTLQDLHKKYIAEYTKENETPIEYKVFINYTRELIKQGIMY